jgi:lipopolysaccharide/colanic/teichoic acid biosynthesis glycosyltransferase
MLFRLCDILFATIGLMLAAPFLFLIALAVKLESRGPAIFVQERLGQFKKPFKIVKFRTMVADAETNGPVWAQNGDPRITRLGRILRKSRLDELPQLINILKGDLSFVGPRPIRAHFAEILEKENSEYGKRFLVKPGLTGYAQIYAPYGSTIDEQLQKLQYDRKYLNGITLREYMHVIFLTALKVIRGSEGV